MGTDKQLQELYEEVCHEAVVARQENNELIEANRCLSDFVHWKGLDEEFEIFQKHAVLSEDKDSPFPRLTLPK